MPILADYFFEFILRSQKIYGISEAESGALKTVLRGAYRFVFPQRTTDMAEDAVKNVRKLAPFLTLPAKWTWIEFVNPDEGVLINGVDNLSGGAAIYVKKEKENGQDMVSVANAGFSLPDGGFMLGDRPDAIPERFQRRLMGAICLLGAPDILERRTVEHSRKWNEAREAKGKMVALDHDVINLHLTRYEKDQEREWYERKVERDFEPIGQRRRRYHFVRAHIRIYENGKVTKVSPHYRGDPALGDAPHTHIVRA